MSFSSDVKTELAANYPKSIHCRKAEIAGIITVNGRMEIIDDKEVLIIRAENFLLEEKIRKLLSMVAEIDKSDPVLMHEKMHHRKLVIENDSVIEMCFDRLKLVRNGPYLSINDMVIERNCCKQSYLRGAFLAGGSIGSPEKTYQLSITTSRKEDAERLLKIINAQHLVARIQSKNEKYVVYIKDGDTISELLGTVGAVNSLMEFENIRILKDIRNSVNREVNCDTANMAKTASAASKQLNDIKLIKERNGFADLPESLRVVAEARLENPLLSIKELGEMMNPPLSKSCINHRMRKLSLIADEYTKRRN
ncbi:MAG: DNA-binding protein WhiA [Eubacterium sp.]|nr:DNA-binding protein WhiA [Eubacterium sp.]